MRSGYKESPPDLSMRSAMDTGPDKVRRRSSNGPRPVSFNLFLTDAQRIILDDFYTTTTASGSFSFDFTHPVSHSTVTARFTAPPDFAANGEFWNVNVALEILA